LVGFIGGKSWEYMPGVDGLTESFSFSVLSRILVVSCSGLARVVSSLGSDGTESPVESPVETPADTSVFWGPSFESAICEAVSSLVDARGSH
jgi:hypothetical protein